MLAKAIKVIDMEIEAIQLMKSQLNSSFEIAVTLLKKTVESDKKIIVIGVGKSGNIGHKIAATLNSTGATSVVLNSQNAFHGDLGIVSSGDVVIALSYSGETSELLDLLPHIKRQDVSLIAITGKESSTLAEVSDCVLLTPISREACPLGLAPTSSSTAALVMGDALAMTLLEARGFTEEEFANYHPGGSLGKALLTRVEDIMRTGTFLALCGTDATVMDAIKAMSSARAGACFIVDKNQQLKGVFSHGDFARAYQTQANLGEQQVVEFMTKDPIKLAPQFLAVQAVKVIQENQVDDVPVVDESGKILGVVDTQDFARLKLV